MIATAAFEPAVAVSHVTAIDGFLCVGSVSGKWGYRSVSCTEPANGFGCIEESKHSYFEATASSCSDMGAGVVGHAARGRRASSVW